MLFKRKSLGIDISNYSVEMVSLERFFGDTRLSAMEAIVLEEGLFEERKIIRKDELINSLKAMINNPKFGKVETDQVVFSLPEPESFILNFELPEGIKDTGIPGYIRSYATENLPYGPEELYFDHRISGREVFLAAVPKDITDDYLEVIHGANLKPIAIEIESISLGRALIREPNQMMVADIGAGISNFIIFDSKKLKLSFSLPVAGEIFSKSLAEKLDISSYKAEALKQKIGVNPQLEGGRVFLILQEDLNEIMAEMRKIDEYLYNKTGKTVEKIVLSGGSAHLPYLSQYLSENLQKPVEIADPWYTINIDLLNQKEYRHDARKVKPALYSTAIGLALRGLEKDPEKSEINLLPTR